MDDDPIRRTQIKTRIRTKNRPAPRASFLDNFLTEWQLFWDGLKATGTDDFDRSEVSPMDPMTIKALTKSLSEERKKLNRRLETIQKEIDLNSAKLEGLKLTGVDAQETMKKINELTDLGQVISEELSRLDLRLDWARKQGLQMVSR